jgi:hypothetical protein
VTAAVEERNGGVWSPLTTEAKRLHSPSGDRMWRVRDKVMGMVNSTPEYTEQHLVCNGFSDLMVAVFGEKGQHARSAVGMGALPFNFAVEIDLVVEVE